MLQGWVVIAFALGYIGLLFVIASYGDRTSRFGRTSRWFGCEHFGFEPDFMTIAKAITSGYQPLGGAMVADRVAEVLIGKGGEFNHGFTWSGHPVACAVAIENLAIMRREKLVDQAREDIGPYLQKRWRELADHPLVTQRRDVATKVLDTSSKSSG